MATKWKNRLEQLITIGSIVAAIIGMYLIGSAAFEFIHENYEETLLTVKKLIRSGLS